MMSKLSDTGCSLADFRASLYRLGPVRRYWVAFSGGLDSSVLVDLCSELRRTDTNLKFTVVHINHGLIQNAGRWANHCASICNDYGLEFRLLEVEAAAKSGESPEEAARNARYAAFRSLVSAGDCLMTAQHMDDQAETILLQLMRGTGVAGLAGMAQAAKFGQGILARPLLHFPRQSLRDYAAARQLAWIDDPSNDNTAFDRNFLRHEILPRLSSRWPSAAKTLTRAGRNCFEAQTLLTQMGASLLETALNSSRNTLSIKVLEHLDLPRQRLVLREWVRGSGFLVPSEAVLKRIPREVMAARADRSPVVAWGEAEVRRYRNELYLLSPFSEADSLATYPWRIDKPLVLPYARGVLDWKTSEGHGINSKNWRNCKITVGFRRGGESLKLVGRRGHHSLKNLFQEKGVPPWVRERLPLIYIDNQLAAVADMWVCEAFQGNGGGSDIKISWACPNPIRKSGD